MDFRSVYQSLTELFPQVDFRILKAVAIEHSNDVHAAVEFILYEVLPSMSEPSEAYSTVHNAHEVSNGVQLNEQNVSNQGAEAAQPEFISCGTAISGDSAGSPLHCSGKVKETIIDVDSIIDVKTDDHCCVTAVSGDPASSTTSFCEKVEETMIDVETDDLYSSLSIVTEHGDLGCFNSFLEDIERSVSEHEEQPSRYSVDCVGTGSAALEIERSVNEHEEQLSRCSIDCVGTGLAALEYTHISTSVDEISMDSVVCGAEAPEAINGALDKSEEYHSRCLAEYHSEPSAHNTEMVSLVERDLSMLLSTRSGHVVNIDLLEDCVTDAKSNKKTLVSAVEYVVNMMMEAELLEQRVKQAKEESSSAGQDILNNAEELKNMLQHAKQANDMHAGEVYGEKYVLSTEARELQSRLLNLSDERNKTFSIIEEIRETLVARLAVANDEIAAADQEKLEKEELAQKALKEQEAIMDTVVQESKKLQKEAEENAKLREFLVDRGRLVDTLQGEIAIICEDVLLLKKRVEERVPLKGSLLMSTYSSVSSLSSFSCKSPTSAGQIDETTRENREENLRIQEVENATTVSCMEDSNASGNEKLSSEDDWEFEV